MNGNQHVKYGGTPGSAFARRSGPWAGRVCSPIDNGTVVNATAYSKPQRLFRMAAAPHYDRDVLVSARGVSELRKVYREGGK